MPDVQADLDKFHLKVVHDLRSLLGQAFIRAQMLELSSAATLSDDSGSHLRAVLEAHRLANTFLTRLADYCHSGSGLDRAAAMSADVLLQLATRTAGLDGDVDMVIGNLPADRFPASLQNVFFELLDNAQKFRRGPVSVKISSSRTESDHVFEVSDNGIGFDPRYGEIIWEPLQRLHGVGEYPGFGFGLAISRRIISELNGRMWAISTPGQGSRFFFSVPAD